MTSPGAVCARAGSDGGERRGERQCQGPGAHAPGTAGSRNGGAMERKGRRRRRRRGTVRRGRIVRYAAYISPASGHCTARYAPVQERGEPGRLTDAGSHLIHCHRSFPRWSPHASRLSNTAGGESEFTDSTTMTAKLQKAGWQRAFFVDAGTFMLGGRPGTARKGARAAAARHAAGRDPRLAAALAGSRLSGGGCPRSFTEMRRWLTAAS